LGKQKMETGEKTRSPMYKKKAKRTLFKRTLTYGCKGLREKTESKKLGGKWGQDEREKEKNRGFCTRCPPRACLIRTMKEKKRGKSRGLCYGTRKNPYRHPGEKKQQKKGDASTE